MWHRSDHRQRPTYRQEGPTGSNFAFVNLVNPTLTLDLDFTMITTWHPDNDATPTPRDVTFMAEVLEGRHGLLAAQVAEFFADYHGERGDAGRAWAWCGVAELVRNRERARIEQN